MRIGFDSDAEYVMVLDPGVPGKDFTARASA